MRWSLINILGLFSLSFTLVTCLYEDQIGKFDWKQSFVGVPKFAYFDAATSDRLVVATKENVLAVLGTKTGEILNRIVLENDPRGEVLLLYGNSDSGDSAISKLDAEYDIITVSGNNPSLVRGWNIGTGNLEYEWSLTPLNPTTSVDATWFYNRHFLYHVTPVWGSHIEVASYMADSGQPTKNTATKISTTWTEKEKCVITQGVVACLVQKQIIVLDLLSDDQNLKTIALDTSPTPQDRLEVVHHTAAVLIHNQLVLLRDGLVVKLKNDGTNSVFIDKDRDAADRLIEAAVVGDSIKITVTELQSGNVIEELTTSGTYPKTLGAPTILAAKCRKGRQGTGCRVLLATADESIVLLQQGKIKWVREEALAKIDAVDFLDLMLTDAEGELEEELKSKEGDVFGAFFRRFNSQITHAKNIFLHVIGGGPAPSASQKAGLVRDDFGLHKIIVAVTKSGKLFGIDNLTGKQHWIKYIPELEGFTDDIGIQLVTQRTSKHFPLPPQCAVVGKNRKTGNGLIFQFNPMNGHALEKGLIELNYPIQQFTLLPRVDANNLKGILLLDNNNVVRVIPEASANLVNDLYVFTADRNTATISGFAIQYDNNRLQAVPTWKVHLGSQGNQQKILKIASKNPIEHVHSQGRVLADRSVLYKYLNPNLVAIVTQGPDPIHKFILNVHLLDVVSGALIFSMSHRRAHGPVNIVHSENWLTYTFYNEKVRRYEVATVELYEGKTQANSTVWSSLGSPPLPLVERQIYIIPAQVATMRETITEKGITNKHVLIGLASGNIVEMPWALLDPRRPSTNPEKAREEGIIPYMPELPLQQESMINYNQTVQRLQGIHAAPSGLESTCLVIAYGLDIFVTRVAPSRTFDLLKEDFDYFLITVVLLALIIASYISKHLASKKIIKQAWK